MNVLKKSFIFCTTTLIFMQIPFSAFAEEAEIAPNNIQNQINESELSRDEGLIKDHFLSVSYNSNKIYLNTMTTSYSTMAEIGEKNIEVLQSTNGVSGWTTYTTVPKQTNSNSSAHYLSNYEINVVTGYYYKVKLTHFAKEPGWFFPDSQSITQTSGIMYIT